MTLLDVPVSRKLPAEVLTRAEVERLMRACLPLDTSGERYALGLRNRAMIAVMYRAGLRCAEALALLPKDLDRAAGTVRVLHGKGDKSRTVGMDVGGFAIVDQWLTVRPAVSGPVFCTLEGKALWPCYVRALMKRLQDATGIEKRIHAHGLRHSHAFELACEGVPINLISRQLGHANSAVTARYIDHLNPSQVIEVIRGRNWSPQ